MLLKVIRPKTGFKPVWFHWTGFKPVCENGLAKDFGECAFESDLPKNCFQTSLEKKLVPKQFLNWFQTSFWNQVGKGLRGLCFWKWFGKTDPNWLRTSLQTAWHLLLSIISAHQIPSSIIQCCGSLKVVFKLQYSAQYLTGVKSSHTCRCDDVAEMRRGTLSLIAASRPNAPPRRNINPVSVALFDW